MKIVLYPWLSKMRPVKILNLRWAHIEVTFPNITAHYLPRLHVKRIQLQDYILSTAVAYLCVIAVQHCLNDPHGEINTGNFPVLVPFNTVVCSVIIVWTTAL